MIAHELEIPTMIIPRESSIFCAAGMLMSDLKHDFVRTYASSFDDLDSLVFTSLFKEMEDEGTKLLATENIQKERIEAVYSLDMRYVKQYHEVNVVISKEEIDNFTLDSISKKFHPEHNRLFGYSLEEEETPIELINMRLTLIGKTDKPKFLEEVNQGEDASGALKGKRQVYLPNKKEFDEVNIYDGFKLSCGNKIEGPAIVEQVNTTTFVSSEYNVICDRYGSYTMYLKSKENEILERMD
jgi:N-methylhydantoinase A